MSASGGLPVIPYADPQYWDDRYSSSNYGFEWFVGYTALRRVLRKYIPKKRAVLHVGCGASNLQEGMAQVGFTVVNVSAAWRWCTCSITSRHSSSDQDRGTAVDVMLTRGVTGEGMRLPAAPDHPCCNPPCSRAPGVIRDVPLHLCQQQ
jgi:hypothetical protein